MSDPVPYDPANPLLASGPSQLATGIFTSPDGLKAGALTIRTPSATVTVFLSTEELRAWSATIASLADRMSRPGVIAATAMDVIRLGNDGKGA